MPNINLAKDRLLDVEARINQKSVPVIITFKNRVGGVDTNRDITGDNIILEVYKSPFLERTTSYVFRLAVGSGLTIQGVDNHQLKVEVTAAQATQWPDVYTWLLISLTEGFAWLSGEWEFFSGARDNPATDSAEIVISDEGDEIIIIIDNGGGSGGDSLVQSETFEIESADLRTIGSDPIILLEALGANIIHPVIGVSIRKDAGTTPYDFPSYVVMKSETASSSNIFLNDDLNSEFDLFKHYSRQGDDEIPNDAFILTTEDGQDATQGDGTLIVTIYYYVNDFN